MLHSVAIQGGANGDHFCFLGVACSLIEVARVRLRGLTPAKNCAEGCRSDGLARLG